MSKLKEAYWPDPKPIPGDYAGYTEFSAEQAVRDLYAQHGPKARELITKFMDELEGRHVQ